MFEVSSRKGGNPMRSILVLLVVLPIMLAVQSVRAQAPAGANSLTFEVASVKPNKSGTTQANASMLPDGVNFVNLPLRGIIQLSFGINQPSKLVGVPDWTVTERFDINARASGPVTLAERRMMLQSLLAERFKLVARLEKREISVFVLMLARNDGKLGPNLVESKGCITPSEAAAQREAPAGAQTMICGPKPGGAGRLILTGMPIQQFTSLLALILDRTVADKTGLAGSYNIDLTFAPEQPIPAGANIPIGDASRPSIYTALREQLGLKLESQRDQEEVLIIDSVQRQPTEN